MMMSPIFSSAGVTRKQNFLLKCSILTALSRSVGYNYGEGISVGCLDRERFGVITGPRVTQIIDTIEQELPAYVWYKIEESDDIIVRFIDWREKENNK